MIREWRKYIPKLVKAIKETVPDAKIYVFGSAVKGEAVGGSDIDILIVSKSVPENNIKRAEIKVEIEKLAGLPYYHPFELHLANENEQKWYFDRIKELESVN
ncbi:MAG: nucleotidyltransferase domain-containing protein [Nitrososphaeria archaeon]|nr:nucleotidyltransferase domain-containing protein [Nitrososphaeria archaeon]